MIQQSVLVFLTLSVSILGLPPNPRILASEYANRGFNFITQEEWKGRPPTGNVVLSTPVNLVIIHHSYIPGACFNTEDCSRAMRSMQDSHQLINGWDDIGYNFAVGSDGQAYEGRGWQTVGAHAFGYNSVSIGIVLIGDWVSDVPPEKQLETTRLLIAAGVDLGFISPDYKIIGHRQVRATECPGDALFQEISNWDRFTPEV